MSRREERDQEVGRRGPFWDVLEGRCEPSFTATEQFLNPVGDVQGGFLAAMLDDTLGPAVVATLGEGC